jgi:quinohemoprotein amine dehydrogenase
MLLDPIMMLAASRAGRLRRALMIAGALLLAGNAPAAFAAPPVQRAVDATAGAAVLNARCAGCHLENGKLQRISGMRKTPEGWDMTIARMQTWHKIDISAQERKTLVKYLADRQGLAPDEAAPYRFLLERTPNVQDVLPNKELGEMCARCHSFGRVALQRREPAEWKKLIHTHLGQFPSIEYSAGGRDRHWRDIAFDEAVPALAKLYPADNASWKKWQAQKHVLPVGKWRIAGRRPGTGDYAGTMQVEALGNDRYDVRYDFSYTNGMRVAGRGQSVLYSGYEWRGDALLGNQKVRSV